MPDNCKYFLGRMHLIAHFQNKLDYIKRSLSTIKTVTERENDWGFFDVRSLEIENEIYYYGYLVKYKPVDNDEMVDKIGHQLTNILINDRVQAKSFFLLHPQSGLIGYHLVSGQISDNQFKNQFKCIFEAANENLLVSVDIIAVADSTEILSAIKHFDSIQMISFAVHPSNPRFSDKWRNIDDKLHSMRADVFKGVYCGKEGLDIQNNDERISEVLMAVDGYGKAKVDGIKDGKRHSVSTAKEPINVNSTKEGPIEQIVLPIINKFKEIWSRMSTNENT